MKISGLITGWMPKDPSTKAENPHSAASLTHTPPRMDHAPQVQKDESIQDLETQPPCFEVDAFYYEMKKNQHHHEVLAESYLKRFPFQKPWPTQYPFLRLSYLMGLLNKGRVRFKAYSTRTEAWYFDYVKCLAHVLDQKRFIKQAKLYETQWHRYEASMDYLKRLYDYEVQLTYLRRLIQHIDETFKELIILAHTRHDSLTSEHHIKDQHTNWLDATRRHKLYLKAVDKAHEPKPKEVLASGLSVETIIRAMSHQKHITRLLATMSQVKYNIMLYHALALYSREYPHHLPTSVLSKVAGQFHYGLWVDIQHEKLIHMSYQDFLKRRIKNQVTHTQHAAEHGFQRAKEALENLAAYWNYCDHFKPHIRFSLMNANLHEVLAQQAHAIYSSEILRRLAESWRWLIRSHASQWGTNLQGTMSELLTFLNLRYDYVAHTLEVTNQAKDARVDTLNQVKLENRLQEKAAYVRTRADMYARVEHYTTQQHIYIKDHFTPIHTVVSFSQTNLTQFYQKLAHLQTNSPSLMSYALDQAKRNQLKVAASLLIEFMNVPPDEVLFHTSTLNTPHQRTETRVGKKHIADELIWEQQITAHKLQQSHQAHILAPQTYEDNRKVGKDREAIYWTLTEQMNAFEFAMKQLMHHHESHNKARQASHITQAEAFAAEWAMVTDADEACGTNNSFEETRPLLHRHKQALPKHLYMTLEPASQEALPVKSLASAKTTLPKKEHKF